MTRTASPKPPETFARPLLLRLAYVVYQVLLHLIAPVYFLVLLLRSRREPLYRAQMSDRFGFHPRRTDRPVWVFAASLGETRAISPVVLRLLEDGYAVALTHTSPAGLTTGRKMFAEQISDGRVTVNYVPVDLFWCVWIFLARTRPQIGIVVEMELWPALLCEAYRWRVPMFQANGNYIDTSMERDRKGLGLRPMLFRGYSRILTKSARKVEIFRRAGAPADRIRLVGELKFDQPVEPELLERGQDVREQLQQGTRVLLIASSVEGEEADLLSLVADVLNSDASRLVVWTPRSPQRFAAVGTAVRTAGFATANRSDCFDAMLNGEIPKDTQVLIGDSIGEMTFYYALSDVVFVGASLVHHGGHNIIEPLAIGKPVLMGPSTYGVEFPAVEAREAGAFEDLKDASAIARRVGELFSDTEALAKMSRKAASFNRTHTGAARRSVEEMRPYMLPPATTSVEKEA